MKSKQQQYRYQYRLHHYLNSSIYSLRFPLVLDLANTRFLVILASILLISTASRFSSANGQLSRIGNGGNGNNQATSEQFLASLPNDAFGLTLPLSEFTIEDLTGPIESVARGEMSDGGGGGQSNQQISPNHHHLRQQDDSLLNNLESLHYQRQVKSLMGSDGYMNLVEPTIGGTGETGSSILGSLFTPSLHHHLSSSSAGNEGSNSISSSGSSSSSSNNNNNNNNIQSHLHNRRHANKEHSLGGTVSGNKRGDSPRTCHPTQPFICPSEDPDKGECIPIQYLCDGSFDCPPFNGSPGGYDEDPRLCTAAKRPPVEETANFLKTLLATHGPQYVEKLFGSKIQADLKPLGGPEKVAIALSVSRTIEDFGKALHLMRSDIDHLRNVLMAVQNMDGAMLKSLGIVRNSELADMKFFLEKLLSTGFLD